MTAARTRRLAAVRIGSIPAGGLADLLNVGRSLGAIDLATGIPGWPLPPPSVLEAATATLLDCDNQYEDLNGNLELRQQIAATFATLADPVTEVTVTVGASEALCLALLSIVDPGDEVIVLEPFYENFLSGLALTGGVPRYVRLREPDWRWDYAELAAAFGPRTRAILLNSPSNPTGKVLDAQELAELAELCERWDVTVISDEVYAGYVYDGQPHVSVADVPGLTERGIAIGSLSKSHAVSGWRLGHVRAPRDLTSLMRRVHIATTCGTAAPFQQAVARSGVLVKGEWDPRPGMQAARDRTVAMFARAGLGVVAPQGGCYVFADTRPAGNGGCVAFAQDLVASHGVMVAPGRFFFEGQPEGSPFVRIAFNKSPSTLDAAEERLAGGLRGSGTFEVAGIHE